MSKTLKAFAGLFGILPGLAVLKSGLGVPPGDGMKLVFGGTIEAFGVLALLLTTLNRSTVRSLSKRTINILTATGAGLTLICLIAYLGIYTYCVVSSESRGTVYFPLWNSGDLAWMVQMAGGRAAAMEMWGRHACYEAVAMMGEFPLIVASAVLLLLYVAVFTLLTMAFAIPATALSKSE